MPWSGTDRELSLFEVAAWFVSEIGEMGFPFSLAPAFFAWLAAASEAIWGIFLELGLSTRFFSALLVITMIVTIMFQNTNQGTWNMLPAMGFLWLNIYTLVLGSGKVGLDHFLSCRKDVFSILS